MPDDGQQLSPQDISDLQEIAQKLPTGHPMQPKINTLLNSQPTQFEQQQDQQSMGNKIKRALGVDEGFLFGGSGEAGGTASAVTPGDVARSFTYPVAEAGGELAAPYVSKAASKLFPSWGKEATEALPDIWRDATKANVPYAGEEQPIYSSAWRDATKENVP